jgi:hypothetical protein
MDLSAQIGWYAAAFAMGIVFASVLLSVNRGSFVWSLLCMVLLVLHPAWTMDVVSGDCGFAKRFMSGAVTLVLVALVMCQIFWPRFSRLRFLLILCGVCWAGSLPIVIRPAFYLSGIVGDGFVGKVLQSFVPRSISCGAYAQPCVSSALALQADSNAGSSHQSHRLVFTDHQSPITKAQPVAA